MPLTFTNQLPASSLPPIVISGDDSIPLNEREFLIDTDSNVVFEIRYVTDFSSFKHAMIVDDILAVGHQEYFYLFDLKAQKNILRSEMDGYFGELYFDEELFYVADAGGLHCINKSSEMVWHNSNLAVDGVLINDFSDGKIFGSGEWDPPGGWRSFVLDKATGKVIE